MQLLPFKQCRVGTGVVVCALMIGAPSQGSAQQPVSGPSQPPPPAAVSYRPPLILLVQPAGDATLPMDKPVIVFRFVQGEANDPIDLASFAVTVDGHDRTPFFQVTALEAWGSLAPFNVVPNDSALAPGIHQLTARICSARGACGITAVPVTVVPSVPGMQSPQSNSNPAAEGAAADGSSSSASSRRRRVIDAILTAVRKLLSP